MRFGCGKRKCCWDLGKIRRKREWETVELRKGAEKQISKWLLAYAKGGAWAKTHLIQKEALNESVNATRGVKCEITAAP